jgi:hypothetical protein
MRIFMKEQTKRTHYYYETFEDFFRASASSLWEEKTWDNETIKGWLRIAFDDARIRDYSEEFKHDPYVVKTDPSTLPPY